MLALSYVCVCVCVCVCEFAAAVSQLSGAFPDLSNRGGLQTLLMDSNRLSGIVPHLSLPHCTTLTASNNQLSGSLSANFFHGLPLLQDIDTPAALRVRARLTQVKEFGQATEGRQRPVEIGAAEIESDNVRPAGRHVHRQGAGENSVIG